MPASYLDTVVDTVTNTFIDMTSGMDAMAEALVGQGKILFGALLFIVFSYKAIINLLDDLDPLDHLKEYVRMLFIAGGFWALLLNYSPWFKFDGELINGVKVMSTAITSTVAKAKNGSQNNATLEDVNFDNPVGGTVATVVKAVAKIWIPKPKDEPLPLPSDIRKKIDEIVAAAKSAKTSAQREYLRIPTEQKKGIKNPGDKDITEFMSTPDREFYEANVKVVESKPDQKMDPWNGLTKMFVEFFAFIPMLFAKVLATLVITAACGIYVAVCFLLRMEYNIGAAVGPIMIAFGIFPPLSSLFESWLRYMFGVAFSYLILTIVMGFVNTGFDQLGALSLDESTIYGTYGATVGVILISIVCGYLMLNIESISRTLIGGGGGGGVGQILSKMSKAPSGGSGNSSAGGKGGGKNSSGPTSGGGPSSQSAKSGGPGNQPGGNQNVPAIKPQPHASPRSGGHTSRGSSGGTRTGKLFKKTV